MVLKGLSYKENSRKWENSIFVDDIKEARVYSGEENGEEVYVVSAITNNPLNIKEIPISKIIDGNRVKFYDEVYLLNDKGETIERLI